MSAHPSDDEPARSQRILNNLPGFVCTFREGLRGDASIVHASDPIERILGFSKAALAESFLPALRSVPRAERASVIEKLAAARAAQTPWHDCFPFDHPTLGRRWLEGWAVPHRAEGGDTVWDGFVMDVTDQKRTERALQSEKHQLQLLFDSLNDLVFSIDLEGRYLEVHYPDQSELLVPPSEFVGRTYREVLPPPLVALFTEAFDALRINRQPRVFEYELELHGTPTYWSAKATARTDTDGTLLGFTVVVRNLTDHRRAEAAERRSEAHFRMIFEMAPMAIVQADPETRCFTQVNQRFCEFLGYTADELVGMPIASIFLPEDADVQEAWVERMLTNATADATVKRYLRKDGRIVWGRVWARARGWHPSGAVDPVAIVEDITAQREAEESQHLQTAALEAAANGIAITDTQGRIKWVNRAFTSLTGYEASEVLGQRPNVLKSGFHNADFYASMWRTITCGEVWHGQLVNRRKDGSFYDEDMTITPVRDANGEVSHFIAIKQDVSEARRTHERLRVSEERYRSLMDNLDDIIYSTDNEDRLTFVNRAISRYGYAPESLIGKPASVLLAPDEVPISTERKQRRLEGEALAPREYKLLDTQGRVHLLRSSARPLYEGGVLVGMQGIGVDVTLQRQTEEQLRASQKMEAVGRLAGGVAHDFNNILSVIMSGSELALMDLRPDDPLRQDLGEIVAAARRAEGLTRQLLAFSRRQVLSPVVLQLDELITGLAKMLKRLIGENIELSIRSAEELLPVLADRGQIEQVVMNLVVNSRDAMSDGGKVSVTVANTVLEPGEAERLAVRPGPHVEVCVRDTGIGMDEATLGQIFEPFFTTKGVGKGTGLGLSVVHGIVRQSGGAITAQSAPGAGATFRVLLPACSKVRRTPSRPPIEAVQRGYGTILVVEDEPMLRAIIRRALTAEGYTVLTAANGEEVAALCDLHVKQLRLVLTDLVMPGMSGWKLAELLAERHPTLKVSFMTGYTEELEGRHEQVRDRLIRKPFDLGTLAAWVNTQVDINVPRESCE